ncbi:DUF1853 family protein [Lacinutrix neustonica]|uniref:DUF1853 family protein n=1 Tax=Lacinutrix neustonica TaxID=2980107 RepID=A0A9E8SEP0_9FLAO|nr:DUF1853 family protein [Lacinutrix neustonica]WAC02524.1 DUF1853 family protein [Lacinutrix neustonica]
MNDKQENLQPQFIGFFNTPHLFLQSVLGMDPFLKKPSKSPAFFGFMPYNIRLGQRVERFVTCEISCLDNIEILSENIQIQTESNLTIGELDCLLLDDKQPVHLEIQFKFYLYDDTVGTTEIDHCIGPMRRDTLNKKLSKLKNKQLPLLYRPETKPLLERLNVMASNFKQQLYFKAQLFVPYGKTITLNTLNPECIYGFYFSYDTLPKFKGCKFYKPKKTDWLLEVTPNVDWKNYEDIMPILKVSELEGYSPMLRLKFENGEIFKCFVTAW